MVPAARRFRQGALGSIKMRFKFLWISECLDSNFGPFVTLPSSFLARPSKLSIWLFVMSSSLGLGIGRIGKKSKVIDGVSASSLLSMRSAFAAARAPGVSDSRERAQSKLLVKNAGIEKVPPYCHHISLPFLLMFVRSALPPTPPQLRTETILLCCSQLKQNAMQPCLLQGSAVQLGMRTNFWLILNKSAMMIVGAIGKWMLWQRWLQSIRRVNYEMN